MKAADFVTINDDDKKKFWNHLLNLLQLRNPSKARRKDNLCIQYILEHLRKWGFNYLLDSHNSISYFPDTNFKRAIVAHTDSVGQHGGKAVEPVGWDEKHGVFFSINRHRPIGGDDKVGVAIALTLLEKSKGYMPAIFPSDEESGGGGSRNLRMKYRLDYAIQNDRKGRNGLVGNVSGTQIAHPDIIKAALEIVPHRKSIQGIFTDVQILGRRGFFKNGFNLECGYFNSHSTHEYVEFEVAAQAMEDTWNLLHKLPEDAPAASFAYEYSGVYDDWWRDEIFSRRYKPSSSVGGILPVPESSGPEQTDPTVPSSLFDY